MIQKKEIMLRVVKSSYHCIVFSVTYFESYFHVSFIYDLTPDW